ncbi:MAG: hypothetical protein WA958_04245 [Tunicatimonas sp.]
MKKYLPSNLTAILLGLVVLTIGFACEEDSGIDPYQPYYLVITGPNEVAPGASITYSANPYQGETYTWEVPAGATLEGQGNDTVTVVFSAASSGNVTVAARGLTESRNITVNSTLPTPTVELADTALAQGGTQDVIISFAKDIETAPTVTFAAGEGTQGGTLGALERVDERSFRAPYTAGSGNGTDEIVVTGAVSNAFFGAQRDTVETTFNVYTTDNIAATATLEASQTPVVSGETVTFTATFNEELYIAQDSVTITMVSSSLLTRDTTYIDNAVMSTLDGINWTYDYQPTTSIDDIASVSISAPADLAGNVTILPDPILIEVREDN